MSDEDLWSGTAGPRDADIVIVGEAWGAEEAQQKSPFVGGAGTELTRILAEAGIDRSRVLLTNIIPKRPLNNEMWRFFYAEDEAPNGSSFRNLHPTPELYAALSRLHLQVNSFPRKLVVGTGNYPLWAFTSCAGYDTPPEAQGRRVPNGIMNWRGSMWHVTSLDGTPTKTKFLPVVHPAAILRQWDLRSVTVHDFRARVPMALVNNWRADPAPEFLAPPSFNEAIAKLEEWYAIVSSGTQMRLVCDVETAKGLLTCIGFASSENFAMCIPYVSDGQFTSYWDIKQEIELNRQIARLLNHSNTLVEGQNFLYDTQYIHNFLGVLPHFDADSMLMHHLLWPGTPKDLGYLSSLYCNYHWYWKEDSKEWDTKGSINDLLFYNCWDTVRTFEIITELRKLIPQLGMSRQWEETKARAGLALRMMLRGVLIDRKVRAQMGLRLAESATEIAEQLEAIIPQRWLPPPKKGAKKTPWYQSPKQQQTVFGEILGMKIPRHSKTGRPSLGKDALEDLKKKYPEFLGLFLRMEDIRSVKVFSSHFIKAELDPDDRMRCFFNPSGTETFRFNSSANAFRRGTNLQNIPSGDE